MTDKALTDSSIGVLVDSKIREAIGWYNSKLSIEREKTIRYYNGEFPKRQSAGSSSYISEEVYNSVESMKAQLLETFAGGQDIVKFDALGPEDVQSSQIATAYTKHVVFSQNDGYGLFSDAIHDGLTARVGVAKVYWDECYEYEDHTFDGMDEQSVMGLAAHQDTHTLDATQGDDGSFGGALTKKIDKSQVKIVIISPEEFSVEPQARNLGPEYFCVHRQLKQLDDLVKEGYDKEQLLKCNPENDEELNNTPEVLARFQQIDSGFRARPEDNTDDTRWLLVAEAYMKFKREGDSYPKLYKVVRCGSETLDIEAVDCHPFVAWKPIPISHSFYGNNFAARVIPTQNISSVLTRAIVDHTTITTNPRYTVLKGGLTNPKELLDNRLGGLINTTRPDAVTPLMQAPLNPFVFQTIGLLQQKLEEITGISSLSQGLNKDAVSNQNSQGLVNDLVNMSQTRQKVIARNFANQFVIPLYLKVYALVIAKEDKQKVLEIAGNWVPITPRQWCARTTCTSSLHLGYGEMDREADKMTQMAALLTQDPQLNGMFQAPGRFKMATDIFKMRGIQNVLDYLTPPDKIPPPQPDPMKTAEMQIEQTKAQAMATQAKAAEDKVTLHGQIEQMKAQLSKLQQDTTNNLKAQEEARKVAETRSKIDISQREMAIAEATAATGEQVVISPK